MTITGKIVIDEGAIKTLMPHLLPFFPENIKLVDYFIEPNRCFTIKIKYDGKKITIKLRPVVYKGKLGVEIFKVFWDDMFQINLSILVRFVKSILSKILSKYGCEVENEIIYLPEITSRFAGISMSEIIFEGNWSLK
jgi:hypothetical protein